MGWGRRVAAVAVLGAGGGLGWGLFCLLTPDRQQSRRRRLLSELPEGNPQRRSEATETKKLLLATLQEAAATQENVAYRKNWNRGAAGGPTGAA
ncbi:ubiquinol-cytochrome-c reductase complex assembly factor 3 [Ornithorhynchus anatinus]|uniref:ubiquinol-cytochrome-c reductase complex assembly factor 3 n=1 Tax=Ornithorhynchus anatinus TaxID=9258 RepID=UPI0010A85697|nr:ubiquinol-cytochrome-c reductase complex assembly factor 3 [Ornithorhynchus anatinus]